LYRFDPSKLEKGENPLVIDSKAPSIPVEQFLLAENRFKMLTKSKPERAKELFKLAQRDVDYRWKLFEYLAQGKAQPDAPTSGSAS
ncbi:MAG TPA: hypothetical protein PLX96_05845, partial [Candidatus Omnitrophota bacterium]|nr:hypothetical protein [Candidatus Omnitrophota bacterium]